MTRRKRTSGLRQRRADGTFGWVDAEGRELPDFIDDTEPSTATATAPRPAPEPAPAPSYAAPPAARVAPAPIDPLDALGSLSPAQLTEVCQGPIGARIRDGELKAFVAVFAHAACNPGVRTLCLGSEDAIKGLILHECGATHDVGHALIQGRDPQAEQQAELARRFARAGGAR